MTSNGIPYEEYRGWYINRGITMPTQGIFDFNVYSDIGKLAAEVPDHIASSVEEAREWVDQQVVRGVGFSAPLRPLGQGYVLLSYREGFTMGNVWEQSDDPEVITGTARDIFGEYGGADNIPSLLQGDQIYLRPNPYNTDFIQVVRRSRN